MFEFLRISPSLERGTLGMRIGKEDIDFILFEKTTSGIDVLLQGSEPIEHLSTNQTLEKIVQLLPQQKLPKKVLITFDASAFKARILTVTLPPKHSARRITSAEARVLEKQILVQAQQEFQKKLFQEFGIHPKEFSFQRTHILKKRIGGYAVEKFEGYMHREIECSVLGVFLLEESMFPIKQFAANQHIKHLQITHLAETIESFSRDPLHSGIYVNIEEEKTRVALRNEKTFMFLDSLNIGAHDFAESFGTHIGIQESTAELLERKYFANDLSNAVQERIQTYLLPQTKKFGLLLKESLLKANVTLPNNVWIFGRGSALRDFPNMFYEEFIEDLPFAQEPKIAFLFPENVWKTTSDAAFQKPLYTELSLLGAFSLHHNEKTTS